MLEQLFVIKNGERFEVDLKSPSGITLNFKSNILGDLSKITCSNSYTFKLPMSTQNRQLFDFAEDIRHISSMTRRKVKAEFYQNGIQIFSNANLYIDKIDSEYSAILTWGVIDGLQELKDNDVSLNELESQLTFCDYSSDVDNITNFNNACDYLKPLYNAGLPFLVDIDLTNFGSQCKGYTLSSYYPLPVVPVHRLIKSINAHFGTKFNISTDYNYARIKNNVWEDTHENIIFNRGVIPLVNAEWTEEQVEAIGIKSGSISRSSKASYCGKSDIFQFITNFIWNTNDFYKLVDHGTFEQANSYTTIEVIYKGGIKFELDGIVSMKLNCQSTDKPKFCIYQKKYGINEAEIVASVEGNYDITSGTFVFDFRSEYGSEKLSFSYYHIQDGSGTDSREGIFFVGVDKNFVDWGGTTRFSLYAKPVPSEMGYLGIFDTTGGPHYKLDTIKKLPDISCMEFVKSLFYMAGAFPVTHNNGSVGILYYSDIKDNLIAGNVINWSSKIATNNLCIPTQTNFSISGYARNNYYKTKTDKLETKEKEKYEDEYLEGYGVISVDNKCLEHSKTIVTLPFSAPFSKSKTTPNVDTGYTFKYWERESDGSIKVNNPNPICGIIDFMDCNFINEGQRRIMTMKCWNGFNDIQDNPSYAYLQEIMNNPIIITENLDLNELDLRDIDYAVPIYLNKYNSYFAIVSIQRDTKGICKCELIKLP